MLFRSIYIIGPILLQPELWLANISYCWLGLSYWGQDPARYTVRYTSCVCLYNTYIYSGKCNNILLEHLLRSCRSWSYTCSTLGDLCISWMHARYEKELVELWSVGCIRGGYYDVHLAVTWLRHHGRAQNMAKTNRLCQCNFYEKPPIVPIIRN